MSDQLFNACTPRFALPLLFAGQAQKELFVNEMASRIDALLCPAIEGEASSPPNGPADGDSWLIGASPQGDWQGHSGEIATFQSGNWLFITPLAGMRLFNKAKGQDMRWNNGWSIAARPSTSGGGTVVDSEARAAIATIIAALAAAGIVSDK